jgi:CRP-like cAMP-binding protein
MAALSRELAVARRKVRELALKGAEARLAALLVQLARTHCAAVADGARLNLPYSRREMAEMIGVSTETAIRLLAALKRKGAIAGDKREIVIADSKRLLRIAQQGEVAEEDDYSHGGAPPPA